MLIKMCECVRSRPTDASRARLFRVRCALICSGGINMRFLLIVGGMLSFALSASLTPANAAHEQGGQLCRAGTPCVILPVFGSQSEIIEPPHNGTAVLRSDGSIYYSPKPGFTGRDSIWVRLTNVSACQLSEKLQGRFIGPRCHQTWRLDIFVE
jgi:hypothetical protein